MILEKTVELVEQIYKYHRIFTPQINKVIIGTAFTGVEIYAYTFEPILGLAYSLPNLIEQTDYNISNFVSQLPSKSFKELLQWSFKPPSLKKIVGIATLNAVSQHIFKVLNPYTKIKGNILNYLKIDKNSRITFIGQINPLIQEVSKITKSITIIEDKLQPLPSFNDFLIKDNINELSVNEILTDILFCTGTSLINNTLENILNLFKKKARTSILIGPTASMIPDILFDYGVDIVCGMRIVDSYSALKILQEGGGTKRFKQYGKKYNLINE